MNDSHKNKNSDSVQDFTCNSAFYILKENFSIIPNPVILNKIFSQIISNKNDELFSKMLTDRDFSSVLLYFLMRNSIRIDWNLKNIENWNYTDGPINLNEGDILSHLIMNSLLMDNGNSNNFSMFETPFIKPGSLASYLLSKWDPQSATSHLNDVKIFFSDIPSQPKYEQKQVEYEPEQVKSYINEFLKSYKITEKFTNNFYPRYITDVDQIKKSRERFLKKFLINHNDRDVFFNLFGNLGYSDGNNSTHNFANVIEESGVEKIGEDLGYSFFSHAHSDHYADFSMYKDHPENSPLVIASRETIEIAKIRYHLSIPDWCVVEKGNLNFGDQNYNFSITPSGHAIGSSSLIIENSETKEIEVFFTSEFRPDMGQTGNHLDPRKCKLLVTELTFTDPNIMFPPYEYEAKRMTDWIMDSVQNGPVILYSYEYGKTQELSMLLKRAGIDEQYPIIFGANSFKINEYCQSLGYPMAKQMMKSTARKNKVQAEENFVLIIPRSERSSTATLNLKKKRNIKDAEISGWCAYPEWVEENPSDEHFIISDHADYQTTVKFIKDCKPEQIIIRYGR